jgi:hypothetical protein
MVQQFHSGIGFSLNLDTGTDRPEINGKRPFHLYITRIYAGGEPGGGVHFDSHLHRLPDVSGGPVQGNILFLVNGPVSSI